MLGCDDQIHAEPALVEAALGPKLVQPRERRIQTDTNVAAKSCYDELITNPDGSVASTEFEIRGAAFRLSRAP